MASHSANVSSAVSLTATNLGFTHPDGTVVFDSLSFSLSTGTYSLVGANGAGKSTLLALLAGKVQPTSGALSVRGVPALVVQEPALDPVATVADVLNIGEILRSLRRIEAGSFDETDFDIVGDQWDAEARATATLTALGLVADLDRPVGTLSGGELTLLAIVAAVLVRPDILLLDEPTTNLDEAARQRLFEIIDQFAGTVLVVSHDIELLNRVDLTLELYHGHLRVFGSGYDGYRQVIDDEQHTAASDVADASNGLRREREEMIAAQIALSRRASTAARAEREKSVPKIVAHGRRGAAEVSAGKLKGQHSSGLAAARDHLAVARDAIRNDAFARIELPPVDVASSRQVIVGGGVRIDGPERVALVGRNGAGKSTLIANLIESGQIVVPYAFVPQRIVFDTPEDSVAEFVASHHLDRTPNAVRAHLARFLFSGAVADKQLGHLSGGERLRAVLASVTLTDPPPDLLILDEPTNSLDIDTSEKLAAALREWSGALLLVCHDRDFRERVGIERTVDCEIQSAEHKGGQCADLGVE